MKRLLPLLFVLAVFVAKAQITLTPNNGCAGTTFDITITGSTSGSVGTPCSAVTGVYQGVNRVIAVNNPTATQASPPVTVSVTIPSNFTPGSYDFTVRYQFNNSCYTGTCVNCFTVNTKPTSVSLQPSGNVSSCEGEPIAIACNATNATSYAWYRNDNATGTSNQAYAATSSGTYVCVATNTCGNTPSDTLTATFNALPAVPTVTANGSQLTANSAIAVSYQWYKDGGLIAGEISSTLTATANGSYTVEITDANGCKSTSAAFVYTSVEEVSNSSFSISPNPAINSININTAFSKGFTAWIVGYDGRVVSELVSTTANLNADVSKLSKGIYLVKIKSGNSELQKRLTIQ